MKLILLITLSFVFTQWNQAPATKPPSGIVDPIKFDESHDLRFSDEKARLDNISIAWKAHPRVVIYLIVYAGKSACVGEAKARGMRAKKYLLQKHVPVRHVVALDGGWKEEVTTEVWFLPRNAGRFYIGSEFSLKPEEIKLERGCKIKYRG